jgi:pimeloyl-ACP methyl ester carboxylesterase
MARGSSSTPERNLAPSSGPAVRRSGLVDSTRRALAVSNARMRVEPVSFPLPVDRRVLDDLKARVRATRWPDQPRGVTWELGADLATVRRLADRWADEFDWAAEAAAIDAELPGYRARIGDLDVHFARVPVPDPAPNALPLMLLHGWPSSFVEMRGLVARLVRPRADGEPSPVSELIVPSLPGHGFSSIPPDLGFGADAGARVMVALAHDVLGHPQVVVHGGDRGAFVATSMGAQSPERIAGVHLTLPTGMVGEGEEQSDEERAWLSRTAAWSAEEGGYSAIQGTRPQTLAYAMHDSPVGQLAWIVEKFRAWSDCGGDVSACFTDDQLLTNATIYWITETMRSASHWYWEHRHEPPAAMRPVRVPVPTGVAAYPAEVMPVPRSAVARKYDLVHWTTMPRGGHFAPYEDPDGLAADIRTFVRLLTA